MHTQNAGTSLSRSDIVLLCNVYYLENKMVLEDKIGVYYIIEIPHSDDVQFVNGVYNILSSLFAVKAKQGLSLVSGITISGRGTQTGRCKNNTNNNRRDSQDGNNPNIRKNTWETLSIGYDPLDPFILFWNNSKHQKLVVKVQDIILMSVNKTINVTHFGFGEFAIVAPIQSESEMQRTVKKMVSSHAHTAKLRVVTLCAGIGMYDIPLVVNGGEACILAKRQ